MLAPLFVPRLPPHPEINVGNTKSTASAKGSKEIALLNINARS